MFSSTIIATINRPTLARAVQSVLQQEFDADDFELIVVNDLGSPLPWAEWHGSPCVTNIVTNRRERAVARNTGAALARGKYLHFMDDDDWLLPGALHRVWETAQMAADAIVLAGGMQVVDGTGKVWGEVDFRLNGNPASQVLGGAYPLLGSYWVRNNAFFACGGFDWRFGGSEDVHLAICLALLGDFAHVPSSVACLLRGVTWTTSGDYSHAIEENRLIRDTALDQPNAYERLKAAANTPYWRGRLAHVYASSCLLNIHNRYLARSLSRGLYTARALATGGAALLDKEYWRGFLATQVPGALSHVMEKIEQASS